jgi:hypothetical protein
MAYLAEKRVDVWELRCRFNKSGYFESLLTGTVRLDIRKQTNVKPRPCSDLHLKYKYSIQWWYVDLKTNDELAQGHYYLCHNGSETPHDPKHLYLDGIHFHLHEGSGPESPIKRDPSLRYSNFVSRWLYKAWRRLLCVSTPPFRWPVTPRRK